MSFSRFVESLSPIRMGALGIAFLWVTLVFVSGGPVSLARRALDWGLPWAMMLQVLGSGLGAVLLVELVRPIVSSASSSAGWSDAKHFKLVGLVWLVLAILALLALTVIRGGVSSKTGQGLSWLS